MTAERRAAPRGGFSLVEIVAALVLLQIGVLAVLGLGVLAARTLASAAELQRAVGSLETVADSLYRAGVPRAGERRMPPHRVRWWREGGGLRLLVERPDGAAVVEVDLPLEDG